ncbi:MAG: hypothetical protein WA790_02780 [Sulfitobacter sp.]
MSIRSWLYVFALGLTLATSGQAQEQTESTQVDATQQQPPFDPPLPFPVEIVEGDAAADARKRGEEEARQREIADLAAQEGMNVATQAIKDATLDMRNYAQTSTWLVAVGTIFLFATIWLTWRAVRDAREIGQKQVRAYVTISEVNISEAPDRQTVVIKNVGTSPAIFLRANYEFYRIEDMNWGGHG